MNKLRTSLAFAKNLLTTGAVTQTSPKVEQEISSKIHPKKDLVIVEFGMGHGNITKAILEKLSPNSRLYSFEVNSDFCEEVRSIIKDPRLHIVNAGAEVIADQISEPIDNIVSSIPFTFFSKELTKDILSQSRDCLKKGGYFSQILYSKKQRKKFEPYFDEIDIVSFFNIPPENIYHCKKL